MAARMTNISIAALKPREERYEISDPQQRGLRVTVHPGGTKTFIVRYRYGGRPKKLTLAPGITLEQARKLAGDAMFEVARGNDPAAQKAEAKAAAQSDAVRAICEEYDDVPDDFYSISVIGYRDAAKPIKLSCGYRPNKNLDWIRSTVSKQLVTRALFWVSDIKLSKLVAKKCKSIFREAGKDMRGGWFDVRDESAIETITFAAGAAGVRLYSNDEARKIKDAFLATIRDRLFCG
jgi:hypothetical protein